MPLRIAFIGKMMSGKTTAANYLIDNDDFRKVSFADPVKEASAEMLNVLAEYIDVEGEWTIATINKEKTKPQVRQLLQLVGTELGRQLIGYENVWVDRLKATVLGELSQHHLVIDDCRFPNEAEALRDMGFSIYRVSRPEKDRIRMIKGAYPTTFDSILRHPSETSLDGFIPDATIHAKTVNNLYTNIAEALAAQTLTTTPATDILITDS